MSENNLNQYDGGQKGPSSGGNGGNNGQGGPGNGNGKDPRKQNIVMYVIAALLSLLFVSLFVNMMTGSSNKEITYNEFIQMLEDGEVDAVTISTDRVYIEKKQEDKKTSPLMYLYGIKPSVTYYTGKIEEDDTLTARLLKHQVEVKGEVADGTSTVIMFLLSYVFPILLMWKE